MLFHVRWDRAQFSQTQGVGAETIFAQIAQWCDNRFKKALHELIFLISLAKGLGQVRVCSTRLWQKLGYTFDETFPLPCFTIVHSRTHLQVDIRFGFKKSTYHSHTSPLKTLKGSKETMKPGFSLWWMSLFGRKLAKLFNTTFFLRSCSRNCFRRENSAVNFWFSLFDIIIHGYRSSRAWFLCKSATGKWGKSTVAQRKWATKNP